MGSDFFRRELEGHEKALGPKHPLTLAKLNDLAVAVRDEDDRRLEAEPLFRRLLAGQEEALGPKHPDTLLTIDNLMDIIIDQHDQEGKLDEAEALCRRLVEAKEEALGPKHPDTLKEMDNLASTLARLSMFGSPGARQGKRDEALALYRRLIETKQEVLGPKHENTLGAMNGLANFIRGNSALYNEAEDQSEYIEAEELYRRALEGFEETNNEHMTREAMKNLATLLEIRGEAATAEELRAQVLARWGVEGEDFEE